MKNKYQEISEIFKGRVEKNIWGGQGFLKKENIAVFLKNGIEGQEVEYRITKKKKQYFEGEIIQILEHSPFEIKREEQKNFLPGCGYQNIQYKEQLRIKKNQLQEIFRNMPKTKIFEIISSPEVFEYRNKMEFSCGFEKMSNKIVNGEKIWKESGIALGFHPAQSWSEVISIDDVFICSPSIKILRKEIEIILKNFVESDEAKKTESFPWNPVTNKGFWRGIIFRESRLSGQIIVNFIVFNKREKIFWEPLLSKVLEINLPKGKKISGILQTLHTGKSDAIVSPQVSTLFGNETIEESLEDKIFEISPFSFFQTNTKGAEVLYSVVREKLGDTKGKKVLDLFCGTGSIGIFCASNAKKVVGIEMIEEAVQMAKKNAKKNNIQNAVFYTEKVENILPELLKNESFDAIIIDPPRSGMHPRVLQLLASLPIKKIVYISCNPATLERDAKALSQTQNWELTEVQGVDMFPHTPHLEVVSVLERK